MTKSEILKAWGRILTGRYPSLSIEITRECPLKCPGCYAYEPEHLGNAGPLRSLADYKGDALVEGVLNLVKLYRPLHLSIVGGEPLVRFRELNEILPRLEEMGVPVQVVTSAVRPIPAHWAALSNLHLAVSIDGLQPDHDLRRKPATYERILKNIEGHKVVVHCTVTRQMTQHRGYFRDFLSFWSPRPEVKKFWFSLFTPQIGESAEEILSPAEREQVITELRELRADFRKLFLPNFVAEGLRRPPKSPDECIFARTTLNFTADLKTKISPCQFGGNPDCSQCGCFASAGLKAVGDYKLFRVLPVKMLYEVSDGAGRAVRRMTRRVDSIQ